MKLVNCSKEYWEFVRLLRIDPRVIGGFIENLHITEYDQKVYMAKNAKHYRILIIEGKAAGYVGVIENDLRVCTDPLFQGIGAGKFMINESLKIWKNPTARVKLNNTASQRLFLSCGFIEFKKDKYFKYYKYFNLKNLY